MKRTFLDKLIGYVSPLREMKRIQARGKAELMLRAYDAAKTFNTDDWTSASKGSSNTEIRGAQSKLRDKGSDAIRNNSYANKAVSTIVSNTVGAGILPHIKGKNALQTKRVNAAWKEWAETSACDSTGKLNFYSMQGLALRSAVERGESLAVKEISKNGHTLRLLESDFINSAKETGFIKGENGELVVQGVKLDAYGRVISYFLFESHPGEMSGSTKDREVPASQLMHVYKIDRPGQLRGVSWFHPVLRQLADLAEYQQATLISRKIGACFSAFITTNDADSTLSASDLVAKRETESMLTPGSIRYLSQGENVTLANPPSISGYEEFVRQTLRSVATGIGISYERLTTDLSNVNYSSARMGDLEFRRNVDHWRWSILIPQFCEPAFEHFLEWCQIAKGIDTKGVTVEWIPPSWSLIDPSKEISAMTDAMRSGLTSYQKAVRELGYDPAEMLEEIAEHNDKLDELKIKLDSDPRNMTKAGLVQVEAAPAPKENSVDENTPPSEDEKDEQKDKTVSDDT